MTKAFDHGGGVRSLRVPIPDNPLGHTLVYVVDTDRGPVLIDTGWDDPTSWDALTAGLTACGTAVTELHGVVITHHHPDHHGLSAKVREASGAWVAMHAADASIVRRTRETRAERWYTYMADKLAAAGAPTNTSPRCARPAAACCPASPRPSRPRDHPRRTPRPARPPAARDLDPGPHPGPCLPPPGGEPPGRTPGPRSPVLRRPRTPGDHPAHRPLRGPRRHDGHRSPRRLPRLPRTRRPARPRRDPPRPPARLHRRPVPGAGVARPPRRPSHGPVVPPGRAPHPLATRRTHGVEPPLAADPLRFAEHRGLRGRGPPPAAREAGPGGGGDGERSGDLRGGVIRSRGTRST